MRYLLFLLALWLSLSMTAQNDCRVEMEDLAGTYDGKCKNGLAHGKGTAIGKDSYAGKFKYGFPHGYGKYTYASGDYFVGKWKKGKRQGKGTYHYTLNGEKIIKEGYWEDDIYVGPKKLKPYKVTVKRNIDRFHFFRVDDGNDIVISINQNGTRNTRIENLMLHGSSGSQLPVTSLAGFENVRFPFKGKIRYRTFNKMRSAKYEVVFEFEIVKPGKWRLTLHN